MNARALATCWLLAAAMAVAAEERMTKEEVSRLEAACEAAREARIKPLREAEIRQCKSRLDAELGEDVQALHQRIGSHAVRLADVRLGNLNTPADLTLAGVVLPEAG